MGRRGLFGVGVDVGWGLDRRRVLVRLFLVVVLLSVLMRGLRDKECVDWGMVGGRTLGHCECEVILTSRDCLGCLR